ncbi:hypothetical protein F5Y03DRAFT_366074 [Xylaria venustula]|nr:hypothetical protein F5Y03DRAFT_366074 [Xylaria venustula]
MTPSSHKTAGVATGTLVETNSFYHILQYFNNTGDLVKQSKHFNIECQICVSKNLSLINDTRMSTLPYAPGLLLLHKIDTNVFGSICRGAKSMKEDITSIRTPLRTLCQMP